MNRFGEFLVSNNIISDSEFSDVVKEQKELGITFWEAFLKLAIIDDGTAAHLLGQYLNIKTATINDIQVVPSLADKVSPNIAFVNKVVPVKFNNSDEVYLCSYNPISDIILQNLKRIFKLEIKPLLIPKRDCNILLKSVYEDYKVDEGVNDEQIVEYDDNLHSDEAVHIVNNILLKALSQDASDIHLEPYGDEVRIRFRMDGILITVETLAKSVANSVISRIKVLSNMNIADRRNPQDGGFKFSETENGKNIRVSTLPCIKGEKVALRIMPSEEGILSFKHLGMDKSMVGDFNEILKFPHGLVFVTGPTGSGKSSTLYTALKNLHSDEINITTIEDPVELQIKGINQTQTDSSNRFTFSKALRTILRQDPNIIMVGEVRDTETARLALESALTGHLVLSTLHTNDSTSAFGRLIDMDCEPFLVIASIRAVLAQRLVRVICTNCKEQYIPSKEELNSLGIEQKEEVNFYRGKGCSLCNYTGYKGRIGIFELFKPDYDMQRLISKGIEPGELRRHAIEKGMKTLRDDGLLKIKKGITTATEVLRATI